MRDIITLIEKYTEANSHLLRYMRTGEFDPYTYWSDIRVWVDKHRQALRAFSKAAGKRLRNADAVDEEEPDLFYKLPAEMQKEIEEWVIAWLMQHDPAEAPTYAQVGLRKQQLIPRNTWLIHFTDNPDGIAEKGFTIGMHDVNKLALTTYINNTSFEKSGGGYNFAFLADSRDAKNAAGEYKYGKHAVMFQNSGVLTDHYTDQEQQVIFHGADVDPRGIVILRHYGSGEWRVQARRDTRRYGASLYTGDFEQCIDWVQLHFIQYRRYLTTF